MTPPADSPCGLAHTTVPGDSLLVEANVPLRIQATARDRIFNLVPGFEAVPIVADFPPQQGFELECRISVTPRGTP